MNENLSGNTFAQARYKELVTDRRFKEEECVKDFCECDCSKCLIDRFEYNEFLLS